LGRAQGCSWREEATIVPSETSLSNAQSQFP
jgi:hypothetical protein